MATQQERHYCGCAFDARETTATAKYVAVQLARLQASDDSFVYLRNSVVGLRTAMSICDQPGAY
jgi:hypothetical protein